jgi:hypothetical protein
MQSTKLRPTKIAVLDLEAGDLDTVRQHLNTAAEIGSRINNGITLVAETCGGPRSTGADRYLVICDRLGRHPLMPPTVRRLARPRWGLDRQDELAHRGAALEYPVGFCGLFQWED